MKSGYYSFDYARIDLMAVRKTVNIDDDLKVKIDKLRKERGLSMKKIVNDAMRIGLQKITEEDRDKE